MAAEPANVTAQSTGGRHAPPLTGRGPVSQSTHVSLVQTLPATHVVRRWWEESLPVAPEGTQWPKRPESAAFDVIREQVGDNAHGPLVVARIKEQYRRGNTPVPSRLDALEQPAARTVTTGHQLCIAGGPAFTYYKIQTAISLAARLERRWGVPVLPVFWLASEDHDFEEVSKVWDGDGWRAWGPRGEWTGRGGPNGHNWAAIRAF